MSVDLKPVFLRRRDNFILTLTTYFRVIHSLSSRFFTSATSSLPPFFFETSAFHIPRCSHCQCRVRHLFFFFLLYHRSSITIDLYNNVQILFCHNAFNLEKFISSIVHKTYMRFTSTLNYGIMRVLSILSKRVL